jgi:hypothetical protein
MTIMILLNRGGPHYAYVESRLVALNWKRQKAAKAASSLPPFVAFCRSGFAGLL